ncbi:uncharacterized protein TM35_000021980 [Trypanosoma theileri]|uniref:DUF4460 domain-containing protein n=1 Tax=Trypanosoma theileri TaxID=67003 RepID=A0A1X0P7G1_9TRYP|nr:uncharacterized protein TM35_000021980 [Trypanosoma theileri]ORC92872.1 hypothetical protein TM35_000021980 [Trypanosoma theileri]
MYKKALHSFFLKVHPDFFHHNRSQQIVNENSVARLNELLSWAKSFKGGTLSPPPARSFTLTFYQKAEDKAAESAEQTTSSFTRRSGQEESSLIQSTFELPENFTPSDAHRGVVERSVNKFLRDLLRRASCIDSITESISAAEDATAQRAEVKPLRRRHGPNRKGAEKPKSLLDEATESMSLQWSITPAPTLEELMEADQVLFERTLSPLQSAAALHTLRQHLGELRYPLWESMPLIISNTFNIGEVTGTLTIPWDFTPDQFLSFIAHNDKALARCRETASQFATKVEQLISEICNELELDDILISCSHKEALLVLQLLHRNKELLHVYGLTNLTLEIGMRHAMRANGVVIISCKLTNDELRPWLKKIEPKLSLQKRLYQVSKQMLEATMWHLKEFRTMAEPGGIDAFNNDCTYAERLEWAKELFRIASSLAAWDWKDMTFVLAPDVDVDWANGIIALPHNFNGDAFVRYVEDVQHAAKSRKREELLEASAMGRQAAEMQRQQQHNRELMMEDEEMETSHLNTQEGEGGKGESHNSLQKKNTANDTARHDRLRDMYRHASPHMEEYLASSSHRVDPLSVERPLTHAVTFNSDAEADQQLRWEGFYADPYVDQIPTGDLDDIAHTFQVTNRQHREDAARQLLEQLRDTYGKKSRRFDYQKMGDVLEINNAKVQPKGFPTLTRGLRPTD